MKKLLLILLCVPLIGFGQETGCISGDCENGYGTYIEVVRPSKYHYYGDTDLREKRDVDSSVYIGNWKNGKKHGKGSWTYYHPGKSNQRWRIVYEGEWKDDKRHGEGYCYYDPGDSYTGEWANDKWEGKGTFSHWAGGIQEGLWKNGKFVK